MYTATVVLATWLLTLLALGSAAAPPPPEASPAARARSHTLVGELVRVDLSRRSVTVLAKGREPREFELTVEEGRTRITWAGRTKRLEDLRPGESILASCSDDPGGRHRALLLKVGPSRYAAPAPRP